MLIRQHVHLHAQGYEQVGARADVNPVELRRSNADDEIRASVQENGPIQDAGVAAEASSPQSITQNNNRIAPSLLIVIRVEQAPPPSRDRENLKEFPEYQSPCTISVVSFP